MSERAQTQHRVLPDRDAGPDRDVRTDTRPPAYEGLLVLLVVLLAAGVEIVGEHSRRADEDVVFAGHAVPEVDALSISLWQTQTHNH